MKSPQWIWTSNLRVPVGFRRLLPAQERCQSLRCVFVGQRLGVGAIFSSLLTTSCSSVIQQDKAQSARSKYRNTNRSAPEDTATGRTLPGWLNMLLKNQNQRLQFEIWWKLSTETKTDVGSACKHFNVGTESLLEPPIGGRCSDQNLAGSSGPGGSSLIESLLVSGSCVFRCFTRTCCCSWPLLELLCMIHNSKQSFFVFLQASMQPLSSSSLISFD